MKISNQKISVNKIVELPNELNYEMVREGIPCRDPFILLYDAKYYLYKRDITGTKIACRVSEDLENWSEEIIVYQPPKDFHGIKDLFWAPECHYYKGYFYIFTSVYSNKTNHRCISVYRADNPLGPFEDVANGCITPPEWDAIDGTLYVDEEGQPWMVFVHEWVSMPDGNGSFVAAKLSDDFTHFISEPIHLFYAKELENATMGVTDGCYMIKLDSGRLMMIWSNFSNKGYVIAKAYSQSGTMEGPWIQDGLLYEKDMFPFAKYCGGHGMIFQKKDGSYAVTYHSPNWTPDSITERMQIHSVYETNNTLKLQK